MIKQNYALYATTFCAFIFTLFFYNQDLGLNVFLMEMLLIIGLNCIKNIDWKLKNIQIFGTGLLLTSLAVVFVFSPYVIAINLISCFIFIGVIIYPKAKSLLTSLFLASSNILASQSAFINSASNFRKSEKKKKVGIFIIPIVIIVFFLIVYSKSSPFFSAILSNIGTLFQDVFSTIFKNLNYLLIFTFLIGLLFCNFVFFSVPFKNVIENDTNSSDEIKRIRTKKTLIHFKFNALKEEYRASVFLLFVLNLILLIVNVLDIYWVWFNFSWNGKYLKQFVHEGTYLLLLSIISSIIIVLYFFRGNLNFYSRNQLLKQLSLIWLAQNAILTISVAIRNFHYIHYFALAYKRIGLMMFLILTIYGLYTVYLKVSIQKSSFYLFRKNLFAAYVVLIGSCLINWENIIADYNFRNYKQSFVELKYLSSFPDKSLPNLDKSMQVLSEIKKEQKKLFPSESQDITAKNYYYRIHQRKQQFIKRYESAGILSWNYQEYKAYQKLKNNK